MYIRQCYNDNSILYSGGGIRFLSLITDGVVANGRRAEYSSVSKFPTDTQYGWRWETKIPDDWEEDDTWCVIAQVHGAELQTSPSLAIELLNGNMIIKTRNDDGSHFIYSKPMIKGEWLKFHVQARWTTKQNGFIEVYINDILEAEFKGQTRATGATTGGYFKCGIYMTSESLVVKRKIYHRI